MVSFILLWKPIERKLLQSRVCVFLKKKCKTADTAAILSKSINYMPVAKNKLSAPEG